MRLTTKPCERSGQALCYGVGLPESTILTYHSIDESGSVISTDPTLFRRQMEWMAGAGTRVVPLEQVPDTPGSLAITFDDGYQNFVEIAVPILAEFRLPATVFVVTAYCGKANSWGTRGMKMPELALMDWEAIRDLPAELVSLGAHGETHRNLAKIAGSELEAEIHGCRSEIEDRTGRPVHAFAYPYGSSSAAARRVAREAYSLACGTALARVGCDADRFDLSRLDAYYLRDFGRFREVLSGGGGSYIRARRWLRAARAAAVLNVKGG